MKTKKSTTTDGDKKGKTLASKLAEVDPEFCEFLKNENDELLGDDVDDLDFGSDVVGDDDDEELDIDDEKSIVSASDSEDEDVVGLSDDNGDDEDIPELVRKKATKSSKKKENRVLTMDIVKDWSAGLEALHAGEASDRNARQIIDQVVAALRCAADKIRPAERGRGKSTDDKGKNKRRQKTGDLDEDEIGDDDGKKSKKKTSSLASLFDFVGAREFQAVVKLCVSRLVPSFLTVLTGKKSQKIQLDDINSKTLTKNAYELRRSDNWPKLKLSLRVYIETIIDLVKFSPEESTAVELLAHLNTPSAQLLMFALPSTRRALVQVVVSTWAKGNLLSSTELLGQCQSLIMSTIKNCPQAKVLALYEKIFRRLYRSYMNACKFPAKLSSNDSSVKTVNAMKLQLAAIVLAAPNPSMAHALAFVRIRQLCAQLRAALSAASAETRAKSTKTVLSWPFLWGIDLWTEVISSSPENHSVRQLVYPLTQLSIGTARLQPSPRYYPLRFHCIRYLNRLALTTNTFIPTISLILDVFTISDFNAAASTKKNVVSSADDERRVLTLSNYLHFSESHMRDCGVEGGMLDAVVNDLLYLATCETLSVFAQRIAFPELSLALVVRLKKFIKVCHVPRFVEKMKMLLSKIEENSRWIEERRRNGDDLHPAKSSVVTIWENEARSANPPLVQFFRRIEATQAIVLKSAANKHDNRKRKSSDGVKQESSNKKPFLQKQQKRKKGKHNNRGHGRKMKKEVAA